MASRKRRAPTIGEDVRAALKERSARTVTDEVKMWEARIKFTEDAFKDRYAVYAENERAVYGRSMTDSKREQAQLRKQFAVEVNKFLPVLASQRERILPRTPWHKLLPQHGGMSRRELMQMRAAERCENFVFRHPRLNFHRNASMFLLGAELAMGVLDVCFTPDEGREPEKNKEPLYGKIEVDTDEETGEEFIESEGDPLLNEQGDFRRRGGKILLDTRDPLDYFDLQYYHWKDVLVDSESGNEPEDLGWVMTRFAFRMDDALENEIFNKVTKDELRRAGKSLIGRSRREAIRPPRPYEDAYQIGAAEEDFLRVTGWRVQDAKNRKVLYLVDGLPDVAGKFDYPGWVGHSTLTFLKFHERLGEFLPPTEVEFARPCANAYNIFWNTLLNHLKRYKRKYLANVNAFERLEQRDQLLDPDDGMVIDVKGNVKGSIEPLTDAPLDYQIFKMIDMAERDFFQMLGSAPEFLGLAQSSSATQASIIDRRGVGREDEKREILGRALEQVADKMLANLQHNLPRELAVRIAGPDGRTWKKTLARPDIQGAFKNHIELKELTPTGMAQETQRDLALIQMVGPEMAFSSEAFTHRFFSGISYDDPQIAEDFTQAALLRFSQEVFGGGQEPGGNAAAGGKESGGPKPTGQGVEEGRTTEGRSKGRAGREFGTLLGPGNTPKPKGEAA